MLKVKEDHNGSKGYKLHESFYVGALNDTSTHHKSEGFQLAGQEENLECKLKEIPYGLIEALRLRYLKFDSFRQKKKNPKDCSWAKLVRILISEGSISLLKILRTKSLAAMFTRLVMKDKLKFCVDDGVLPERGYSQFNDVSSRYLVSKVS
ncbi:hypothetical protein Tco_1137658 [Tanacetum coccineum]